MATISKRKIGLLAIVIILIIGLVTLLSMIINNPDEMNKKEPIKIGVSTAVTGPASFIGQDYLLGLELASKEINAKGGINGRPLVLVIEDNKNTASEGTTVFQALRLKGVDMILTTFSSPSVSLSPLARDNNVPLFISVVFADIISSNENAVSFFPTPQDDAQATIMDMKQQGISSVGIIYVNTEYGKASADAFIKEAADNNIKVFITETFVGDATDFSTPLLKIKEKNPDAIYIAAISVIPIIKQLKTMDINTEIYTNLIPVFGSLVYKDKAVFEGVHLTASRVALKGTEEYTNFRNKFETQKNDVSLGYASIGYDNLHAIAKILKKEPDVQKFVPAFSNHGEFKGINGMYNLQGRNVGMKLYPVVFTNGELVEVKIKERQ